MKNIKRLFLLATLIIIAIVVFESDFKAFKAENNTIVLVNNE
jgi:hypothetical protein